MKYQPVIGLEIHVELSTESKMFCGCPADWFGKAPNSQTCPVCLGLPGALPVPNKKAVEGTILLGLALGCKINRSSKFDRKHYFYPDLPKGYQISQYDEPIAQQGKFEILNSKFEILKKIRIRRVHLEEDTGKLIHKGDQTLIDFNRSGVPLMEIVTEPDFTDSEAVKNFLEELQVMVRYLGISDADMEKGSMRLEPNISLRKLSLRASNSEAKQSLEIATSSRYGGTPRNDRVAELPNYKVEVKNINSFKFAKRAIEYEINRQSEILDRGETPAQETRGWDENQGKTVTQRTKEEAHDYRYFPEPDIPPIVFTVQQIAAIKNTLPELPVRKLDRYMNQWGIKYDDAFILTRDRKLSERFEMINSKIKNHSETLASLLVNKKLSMELSAESAVFRAQQLLRPKQTDEGLLERVSENVIRDNPKPVADYRAGKENAIMFLIGAVMKEMRGKADARLVRKKIEERLKK